MAEVTVTVTGASRDVVFEWNHAQHSLTSTGQGGYCTAFESAAGTFEYSVTVSGAPSDPWTAKITDGTNTNSHAGHMSPTGSDSTGDFLFEVT